jgi:hypothetical protein
MRYICSGLAHLVMLHGIQIKEIKPSLLERFGVYYLRVFGQRNLSHHVFDFSDEQLTRKVDWIEAKGIVLSALTGLVLVWPTVWINLVMQDKPWYIHYGWVGGVTAASVVIELYLLYVIAIRAVHEVSELINARRHAKDFLESGPFSITNILSRAALEIHDPEMNILGIDPFERVSKKNLVILSILYKAKIFLTNLVSKFVLGKLFGQALWGISITYVALPVECFWNGVVLRRVVQEARLRMFGFALSNHIADHVLHDRLLEQLSPQAKIGCLRALGNAVVMAQNYHPNMIMLLLRFQHLLHIHKEHQYDSWELFLDTLKRVNEQERDFLLNLFTIAVAFDGKISKLEANNLKSAYGEYYEIYQPRLMELTGHLKAGRLNAAAALCKVDFSIG